MKRVDDLRQAVVVDPQDSKAWFNLGFSPGKLGRREEAVESFRRTIEIDPHYTAAWNNLGFVLGELGRLEEAVEALNRATEIDPQHPKAWYNLELAIRRIQAVQVARDCAAVDGKFEYTIKVKNYTTSLITNVTITILAYPDDCMSISGPPMQTLKRIGAGESASPQFIFVPTKDCVEGRIVATVSYMDYKDRTQMLKVEPYIIESVSDN